MDLFWLVVLTLILVTWLVRKSRRGAPVSKPKKTHPQQMKRRDSDLRDSIDEHITVVMPVIDDK